MRFYTHIPAGLLLYTVLVWALNQPYSIAGILIVVLFSILPDLVDKVAGEHRGWGHSVIWLIPIAIFFLFKVQVGLACFSAFSMHILLDSVTKTGVPFFYPFSKTSLVMPKKEKSRIQTGSKQETALCVVIILFLIPVTYCTLFGVPGDLFGSSSATNATKLNKTGNNTTALKNSYGSGSSGSGSSKYSNSTSPLSSLTKDLSSSGSSKTGSKTGSSTNTNTNTNSTSDVLVDWLDQDLSDNSNNNNSNNDTSNNNNSNSDNSNDDNSNVDGYVSDAQTITDYSTDSDDETVQEDTSNSFYDDLRNRFADLEEGVQLEENSTSSDQSMFDFDFTENPDASSDSEDSSVSDQLGLMLVSLAAVFAGGGLVGKG